MKNEKEINKLISAALVSERFRTLLLSDPQRAIETGYNGETFQFESDVIKVIVSSRGPTLDAFVHEVIIGCNGSNGNGSKPGGSNPTMVGDWVWLPVSRA